MKLVQNHLLMSLLLVSSLSQVLSQPPTGELGATLWGAWLSLWFLAPQTGPSVILHDGAGEAAALLQQAESGLGEGGRGLLRGPLGPPSDGGGTWGTEGSFTHLIIEGKTGKGQPMRVLLLSWAPVMD